MLSSDASFHSETICFEVYIVFTLHPCMGIGLLVGSRKSTETLLKASKVPSVQLLLVYFVFNLLYNCILVVAVTRVLLGFFCCCFFKDGKQLTVP